MGLFNNIVIKNIRFRSKCCTRNDDNDSPSTPSTPKNKDIENLLDLIYKLEQKINILETKSFN